MKQEIKEKWVAALRSGEYQQTRSTLRDGTGFCCLGVLTDIYTKENNLDWDHGKDFKGEYYSVCSSLLELPNRVVEWAELPRRDPRVKLSGDIHIEYTEEVGDMEFISLSQLNDGIYAAPLTFSKIADIIENQKYFI
jgi:hypothetical protein